MQLSFEEVARRHKLEPDGTPFKGSPYRYYRFSGKEIAFTINVKANGDSWHAHRENVSLWKGATPKDLDVLLTGIEQGVEKLPKKVVKKENKKKPDVSTKRRIIQPYSSITYHKDWQKEPIRYSVLAVNQLSPSEAEAVRARIKTIVSAEEAKNFVYMPEHEGYKLGWSFKQLTPTISVLAFKGIEVAVYYQRQRVDIEPAAGDPIPVGVIDKPEDVYQRFDLLGPSAREANRFIKAQVETTNEIARVNAKRVATLEALVRHYEHDIEGQKRVHRSDIKRLKNKKPGVNRIHGHIDVLSELTLTSARLANSKARVSETTPAYKEIVAARVELQKAARTWGYKFIVPVKGEQFNSELHEVVGTTKTVPLATIAEVVDHGLAMPKGNRLIKRAQVVVGGKTDWRMGDKKNEGKNVGGKKKK